MLQEAIRNDLTRALKAKNILLVNTLRILIAEIQREPTKEVPDTRVIKIIKKLISQEQELKQTNVTPDQDYIDILNSYLPDTASDQEIINWIKTNIDLSQFKNRMQAMKPIMANFSSRVDGNRVKEILNSL